MSKLIWLHTADEHPVRIFLLEVSHIREAWPLHPADPASPTVIYLDPYEGNNAPVITVVETLGELQLMAEGAP